MLCQYMSVCDGTEAQKFHRSGQRSGLTEVDLGSVKKDKVLGIPHRVFEMTTFKSECELTS